jgi:hypothetical protein
MLLGAWWFYRGKFATAAYVLMIAGSWLVVLGGVEPRFLVVPRRWWMKLAEGMSYVSSRIILAIIFFLVLTPIGLIKRARRSGINILRAIVVTTRRCFERQFHTKAQRKTQRHKG